MRIRVRVVHAFHVDTIRLDGLYVCTSVEEPSIRFTDKDKNVASMACYRAIMEHAKTKNGATVATQQWVNPGPMTEEDMRGESWAAPAPAQA